MDQSEILDIEYVRKQLSAALHLPAQPQEAPDGTLHGTIEDDAGACVARGDMVEFVLSGAPCVFLFERMEKGTWRRHLVGPNGPFTCDRQWPLGLVARVADCDDGVPETR